MSVELIILSADYSECTMRWNCNNNMLANYKNCGDRLLFLQASEQEIDSQNTMLSNVSTVSFKDYYAFIWL